MKGKGALLILSGKPDEWWVQRWENYSAYAERQAYISQQLMILKQAGVLESRRDGLNLYYRVIKPDVFSVLDAARLVSGRAA